MSAVIHAPEPRQRLLAGAIAPLLYGWAATTSIRRLGRGRVERLRRAGRPNCYAMLHGRQIPLLVPHRQEGLTVLVSGSQDGALETAVLERLGYTVVRGSSSASGASGLRKLVRAVEGGGVPVLAVDGPRGPAGSVAGGVIALAQLSGASVVPIMASVTAGLELGTWDKTLLPRPLSRALILYGRPLDVTPGAAARDAARDRLSGELRRLQTLADRLCGRPLR